MPTQTEEQRQAAFTAAGLTPGEQEAVKAGRPYSPAARGDDFASDFESGLNQRGLSLEEAVRQHGSVTGALEFFGGSTLSNANILDNKISLLDTRAKGLPSFGGDAYGSKQGAELGSTYSYEDILGIGKKKKNIEDLLADDPYAASMFQLLEDTQGTADRNSQELIANIQNRFAQRQEEQSRYNAQNLAAVKQALNLGGSSRYAPISSTGIVSAQEAAGVRAIADLQAQEAQYISEARQAHQSQNYRLLEQKLNLIEGVRQNKLKAAEALNKEITARDTKLRTESAVFDALGAGATDALSAYQYLRSQGLNVPIEEIDKILKIANPPESMAGLSADYRTFREMQKRGEIPKEWEYFDYLRAVGNARRVETEGGGQAAVAPQKAKVPPYEQWWPDYLKTPEGKALAQKFGGDNIGLAKELRKVHASMGDTTPPLKATNTQLQKLSSARLDKSPTATQEFFLTGTNTTFQQWFTREISPEIAGPVTRQEMAEAYRMWQDSTKKKSTSGRTP